MCFCCPPVDNMKTAAKLKIRLFFFFGTLFENYFITPVIKKIFFLQFLISKGLTF